MWKNSSDLKFQCRVPLPILGHITLCPILTYYRRLELNDTHMAGAQPSPMPFGPPRWCWDPWAFCHQQFTSCRRTGRNRRAHSPKPPLPPSVPEKETFKEQEARADKEGDTSHYYFLLLSSWSCHASTIFYDRWFQAILGPDEVDCWHTADSITGGSGIPP